MVDFYGKMQTVAENLLTRFKQGAPVYVEVTPGNGPVDNPGPSVETPHPIKGTARGVRFKYIDGSHIVASDMQITMPGTGIAPKMNGFIRNGTERFKIIEIKPIPPIGTPVVHVVIFRK